MIKENDLIGSLHKVNPYDNFDGAGFKLDIQGWGSDRPIFRKLIDKVYPSLIIEIGTWKGGSAINMGKFIKEKKLNCKILCIDTWLGSLEHWKAKDSEKHYKWYASLNLKNGYPQLYHQFLYNVIHSNLQDIIIPFPNTSAMACKWLKWKKIEADLIYVDGSHEEAEVYADITGYYNILRKKGVLFGDDFNDYWPGLQNAVRRFVKENKLNLKLEKDNWIINKK